MGNCCQAIQAKQSSRIETALINDTNRRVKKVLLLGTGSSGKSTIFKQLKCIHGLGFENGDFNESLHNTRRNLVLSTIRLLRQSDRLYHVELKKTFGFMRSRWTKSGMSQQSFPPDYLIHIICSFYSDNKFVSLEDAEIVDAIETIVSFRDESFELVDDLKWDKMEKLGDALKLIWNLDTIQYVFARRGVYAGFTMPDNIDFFMSRVFNHLYLFYLSILILTMLC